MIRSLIADTARGLRSWRRTPGSALLILLALGLSGGALLTLVSLVNALFWRDLPVSHPEELVAIGATDRTAPDWENVAVPASVFAALSPSGHIFQGIAGFSGGSETSVAIKGSGQRLTVEGVTDRYFETLGVRAAFGRLIGPRDVAGALPVATISFRCWQTRFGADPQVIGQTFRLHSEPVTVIGVAPRDFEGFDVGEPAEAWVPAPLLLQLDHDPDPVFLQGVLGRLRPGVTLQEASAEIDSLWPLARQAAAAAAPAEERSYILAAEPRIASGARGFSEARGLYGRTLILLALLSGITVVLACVNLSGLLLARWSTREQELAVQAALGASNARLIAQIVGESLALSTAAVLLSLPVALWSAKSVVLLLWHQPDQFPLDLSLDYRVLGVMVAVAGLAALGVSLLPASRVWSAKLTLARGARGLAGRSVARWGRRLAGAQVALSVPLLATAWIIAVNLHRLEAVNTGFRPEGVTVADLSRADASPRTGDEVAYLGRLDSALRGTPGTTAVGFSLREPVGGFFSEESRRPVTSGGGLHSVNPFVQVVSPGYFEALSLPLLAGRDFGWTDDGGRPNVAVITAGVARSLFPGADPIGQRVRLGGAHDQDLEVIGVVADANLANPHERNQLFLYTAMLQQSARLLDAGAPVVVLKSPLPPGVVRAQADRAIVSLRRDDIYEVRTLLDLMTGELVRERVMRLGAVVFAGLTAILVFVGLYAVLNFGLARRIPEIGLRVALGASRRDIRILVIREALWTTAAGLIVGVPCAVASGRVIASTLTLVGPHEPLTFAAAVLLILATSVLSVLIPLRRATRITPIEALGSQ